MPRENKPKITRAYELTTIEIVSAVPAITDSSINIEQELEEVVQTITKYFLEYDNEYKVMLASTQKQKDSTIAKYPISYPPTIAKSTPIIGKNINALTIKKVEVEEDYVTAKDMEHMFLRDLLPNFLLILQGNNKKDIISQTRLKLKRFYNQNQSIIKSNKMLDLTIASDAVIDLTNNDEDEEWEETPTKKLHEATKKKDEEEMEEETPKKMRKITPTKKTNTSTRTKNTTPTTSKK